MEGVIIEAGKRGGTAAKEGKRKREGNEEGGEERVTIMGAEEG